MKNFILGLFIGAGSILPGISSGVFLVAFGIYEKLIDSILHFFSNVKDNIKFLLPIGLGAFSSIIIFANILIILFNTFHMPTCFSFIGLILGSIPTILKQAHISKVSFLHIICILVFLSFSIYLTVIENIITHTLNITYNSFLFLAGFLMSAGVIIPGISKTAILMLLGVYETYLVAISSLNIQFLIPMGLGIILGGIIFLVLLQLLFKYVKQYTYCAILGFVIGSIFVVYPGFTFNSEGFISIILLCVCFLASWKLG